MIYEKIKEQNDRYLIYNVRRTEFQENTEVPFRVAVEPFKISREQKKELEYLGIAVCDYVQVVIDLYNESEIVRRILNKGKLGMFIRKIEPKYLFIRPDIVLTDYGFKICEIETSIFGLALAEILNKAYIECGYSTIIPQNALKYYITSNIPNEGVIAYSDHVKAFSGQLDFLAKEVFSTGNKTWNAQLIDEKFEAKHNIYRAFYCSDYKIDSNVSKLLTVSAKANFLPSLTPQFEEKAILALIWDKRFESYFKEKMSSSMYEYLRKVIPPTWILGEEKNSELEMPCKTISDIATMPKSKRRFVLKKSGDSSWGEGITFLHKVSHEKVRQKIQKAEYSESLYVLQQFYEGTKSKMKYFDCVGNIMEMEAKVRLTPYYSFCGADKGKLVAIKATGCENTDYIHGATNSINTAVSIS